MTECVQYTPTRNVHAQRPNKINYNVEIQELYLYVHANRTIQAE